MTTDPIDGILQTLMRLIGAERPQENSAPHMLSPVQARPPAVRENIMPEIDQLFRSPFVQDTLLSLMNGYRPSMTEEVDDRDGTLGAWFNPSRDELAVTRKSLRMDRGREDIAHEFGHALDLKGIAPEVVEQVKRRHPEAFQKAVEKGWIEYEDRDPTEYFAGVFRKAIDALALEQRKPSKDAKEFWDYVAFEEDSVPGIKAMLEHLLKQDIYKQHPAQKWR
jgi:hypothetical protein